MNLDAESGQASRTLDKINDMKLTNWRQKKVFLAAEASCSGADNCGLSWQSLKRNRWSLRFELDISGVSQLSGH